MSTWDIEIEYSIQGPSGIMRYDLNKREINLNNFHPGYFLNNDYVNGMNYHNNDFHEETLKNWVSDLL